MSLWHQPEHPPSSDSPPVPWLSGSFFPQHPGPDLRFLMADLDIPFAPVNVPLERSLYIGNILRAIIYGEKFPRNQSNHFSRLTQREAGLEIFTFLAAVYCISHRPPEYRKGQKCYVIHGGILVMLVTISLAANSMWGQYMWIDHRNYPGGPLGFYRATQSAWYNVLRFAADVTANILGDGLLVRLISVEKQLR